MCSIEHALQENIVEERNRGGTYESLEDFIRRVPVGKEAMQTLIFVGAFQFTGVPKHRLILEARMLLSDKIPSHTKHELFYTPAKKFRLPSLDRSKFEDAFDEIELLGFSVSSSPFDLLQTNYRGNTRVKEFVEKKGESILIVAYLIARKNVPTARGDMNFGTG